MSVSIQDLIEKIKLLLVDDGLFTVLLMIMVGVAGFGLGRQSVEPLSMVSDRVSERQPSSSGLYETSREFKVENRQLASSTIKYVASKNSDKYHLPWCSGAQRIAEENLIYFTSKEEAEMAGYTPAANCKGI